MDWKQTAEKIRSWNGKGPVPDDPWVRDALRGTMWEDRWMGSLEEYLNQTRLIPLVVRRTALRLESCPKANWKEKEKQRKVWNMGLGRIGLGTYRWKYDPKIILEAIRLGATIIDTAEGYGYGRVEASLKYPLKGYDGILATKVARTHMSQAAVANAACRSLARLGVEKIDLYQIHWPSPKVPLEDTATALNRLVVEGKIEAIGVCNFSCDMVERLQANLDYPLMTLQTRLNMIDRTALEVLYPFCNAVGVQLIAYSPLCQDFRKLSAQNVSAREAVQWVIREGAVPIPQTNNLAHLKELLSLNHSGRAVRKSGE